MVPIAFVDPCLTAKACEDRAESNNPRLFKISRRHRRLAHLIASGFSRVQTARELNLKPNTVRVYVHEMRQSLARMAA
jgi:DNA-binding NarL/FixJ family response regulator